MKVCSKCGILKAECEFHKRKALKSGYRAECKICGVLRYKDYRKANLTKVSAYNKAYKKNNKEYLKVEIEKYRKKNIEKIAKKSLEWSQKNKEKSKNRDYYIITLLKSQKVPEALMSNKEIIEVKKLILKIKRYVKKKTNN